MHRIVCIISWAAWPLVIHHVFLQKFGCPRLLRRMQRIAATRATVQPESLLTVAPIPLLRCWGKRNKKLQQKIREQHQRRGATLARRCLPVCWARCHGLYQLLQHQGRGPELARRSLGQASRQGQHQRLHPRWPPPLLVVVLRPHTALRHGDTRLQALRNHLQQTPTCPARIKGPAGVGAVALH